MDVSGLEYRLNQAVVHCSPTDIGKITPHVDHDREIQLICNGLLCHLDAKGLLEVQKQFRVEVLTCIEVKN